MWFSLRGTKYQNNSNVTLEDIGEGDDALLCMTMFNACGNASNTMTGEWFFPNGTEVNSSTDVHQDFYITRGQTVVCLNRRSGGEEGIYRCQIPDSLNVTQTIYIKLYTANTSTGE